MAKTYSTLSALFTDIADAIREKTGEAYLIIADDFPDVIRERLQVIPPIPAYLTFSSPNSFTLAVNDATKHWDGTLEYSTNTSTWSTWDGTTTLSSATSGSDNVLYLRGTGNTLITGDNVNYKWVLTGSDIACIGNIEYLLDYATVQYGAHPTMTDYCYCRMFDGCTSLTQAPELPATTLADSCYYGMFQGCDSLKLSSTKTGEYTVEYRIPSSGTGTTAIDALTDMFLGTHGTFTGTPEINTTYYLSNTNTVVQQEDSMYIDIVCNLGYFYRNMGGGAT